MLAHRSPNAHHPRRRPRSDPNPLGTRDLCRIWPRTAPRRARPRPLPRRRARHVTDRPACGASISTSSRRRFHSSDTCRLSAIALECLAASLSQHHAQTGLSRTENENENRLKQTPQISANGDLSGGRGASLRGLALRDHVLPWRSWERIEELDRESVARLPVLQPDNTASALVALNQTR